MKRNSASMRFTEMFKEFNENLGKNIVKCDGEPTSTPQRVDYIVKFFKYDNDAYIRMINLIVEDQKNVR